MAVGRGGRHSVSQYALWELWTNQVSPIDIKKALHIIPNLKNMDPKQADKLLEIRKELMRCYSFYSPVYSANQSFMRNTSWLVIPQNHDEGSLQVLYHNKHHNLYVASFVGIVNADDLAVEPHGNCNDPATLQSAELHFSIRQPKDLGQFTSDFNVAHVNLDILFRTLCQPGMQNGIAGSDGRVHFNFPIFQKYRNGHEVGTKLQHLLNLKQLVSQIHRKHVDLGWFCRIRSMMLIPVTYWSG